MSRWSMLPSSETKPITMRKLGLALLTEMPWVWTICGSEGVATASLFWTWTCAVSGFTPLSKVSVIVDWPLPSLVEAM